MTCPGKQERFIRVLVDFEKCQVLLCQRGHEILTLDLVRGFLGRNPRLKLFNLEISESPCISAQIQLHQFSGPSLVR